MISAKPWTLEAVARLFLGVIFTLCAGVVMAGLLPKMAHGLSQERVEFLQMVAMVAFFQGAALIWIGNFLRQSNISWRAAFGLRPPSRVKAVAVGVTVGLCVLPVMWALQWLSEDLMEWLHLNPVAQAAVTALQKSDLSTSDKIVFAIFTILLAPVAEEALFRGVLYPTIKQMGYPRLALWGTSVFFGVMHVNLAALLPLVLLAVILVHLYEASGSLLTPIATHSVFNAANYIYLLYPDPINRFLHIS